MGTNDLQHNLLASNELLSKDKQKTILNYKLKDNSPAMVRGTRWREVEEEGDEDKVTSRANKFTRRLQMMLLELIVHQYKELSKWQIFAHLSKYKPLRSAAKNCDW